MKRFLTTVAVLVIACATVFAQGGYTVKGVVVDAQGPVIGAAVLQQGTSNGTSTGIDGDYTLTVPSGDAIIEVSCIG
ncbi:MAG: carboxypeptidase-like regulatory domain-containing protein, partial [Bacteroidales bacterium]|nr:carboxypeptidase-like regulatory domain-containing protein [Bacteroidales bacterium]